MACGIWFRMVALAAAVAAPLAGVTASASVPPESQCFGPQQPPAVDAAEEDASCLLHKPLPPSSGSAAQLGNSERVTGTLSSSLVAQAHEHVAGGQGKRAKAGGSPVAASHADQSGSVTGEDRDSGQAGASPALAMLTNGSLMDTASPVKQAVRDSVHQAAGHSESAKDRASVASASRASGSLLAAASWANKSAVGADVGRERAHAITGQSAKTGHSVAADYRSAVGAALFIGLQLGQNLGAPAWAVDAGSSKLVLAACLAVLCALVSLILCFGTAASVVRGEPMGAGPYSRGSYRSRQLVRPPSLPTPTPTAQASRMVLPPTSRAVLPSQSVVQPGGNRLSPNFASLPSSLLSLQAPPAPRDFSNGAHSRPLEPAATSPERYIPPALCPPLVLPDRETHLAVPSDELDAAAAGQGGAEFDVFGPLSTPVFRAALQDGHGGRWLSLFVPRLAASQPWVGIRPLQEDHREMIRTMLPEGSSSCGKVLEIVGQDGEFYGLIVAQRSGTYWAIHRSLAVLVLEGDRAQRRLRATANGGRLVASIAPLEKRPFGGKGVSQQLDLQVHAGVDPLLVLACMLTVILLF
uniref:Uncharacterized protein n=1 Tax=Alexandrium monilatum TaxID=311494 RepID=A0A7S4QW55_9DINO